MDAKFIQRCYIRKNTPELREKLEALGYKILFSARNGYGDGLYAQLGFVYGEVPYGGINCGENDDLFLALAARREDTDEHQWFVMDVEVYADIPKGTWFKATNTDGGKHIGTQIDPLYCHKATVGELIEHFINK